MERDGDLVAGTDIILDDLPTVGVIEIFPDVAPIIFVVKGNGLVDFAVAEQTDRDLGGATIFVTFIVPDFQDAAHDGGILGAFKLRDDIDVIVPGVVLGEGEGDQEGDGGNVGSCPGLMKGGMFSDGEVEAGLEVREGQGAIFAGLGLGEGFELIFCGVGGQSFGHITPTGAIEAGEGWDGVISEVAGEGESAGGRDITDAIESERDIGVFGIKREGAGLVLIEGVQRERLRQANRAKEQAQQRCRGTLKGRIKFHTASLPFIGDLYIYRGKR